jgi:hypothetical protein
VAVGRFGRRGNPVRFPASVDYPPLNVTVVAVASFRSLG